MRRILYIIILLSITNLSFGQKAQQLKVYQKDGVVDTLRLTRGATMEHSRLDTDGVLQSDYVSVIINSEGTEHQYLFSAIDSLVLPNGRRVVFRGSTSDEPQYARKKTSFRGTFPGRGTNNVQFFWTENDRIRLDAGYESRAENLTSDKTGASFVFDGADFDAPSYMVYYPDKKVVIPSEQTQTGADNTDHIGVSGDCGTGTAVLNEADGSYSFTLSHKAAYLCFLPHIDYLPSAKITKIVLTCSEPIAGEYQLSSAGLYAGGSTSKTITLNLNPLRNNDFFIGHNVNVEQDTCAAYMVIAPQNGSRTFTATYYVTDTLSRIEKIYNQTFSFAPVANTVYPITCNIPDTEFRCIDLGLSVNWSNVNINAVEPSESGTYYDDEEEANNALLANTVVTSWLMPTDIQKNELLEKCQWTWGEYNGVFGYFVEGAAASTEDGNVHRLFIPSSSGSQITAAACLNANSRPVEALMIDLGLPSGTKWASRNIGANSVEGYGHYFAWGETDTKDNYNSSNYFTSITKNLGNNYDISGTQNDVALVKWGGAWRMPSKDDFQELLDKCTWTWSTINGVTGYLVEGSNGRKIFLPNGGVKNDMNLSYNGSGASFWTSTQEGNNNEHSYTLSWNSGYNSATRYLASNNYAPFWNYSLGSSRYYGHTVRPVAKFDATADDGSLLSITTDSTTWKLGATHISMYGTLFSSMPVIDNQVVGFLVGDRATVVKGEERFDFPQTVSVAGSFSQSVDVYDNIGYWYRAYVKVGDKYYYSDARHYAYEMVDLGLESGTLWANMNVGASTPGDYGNYYAWGEITTKTTYNSSTYAFSTSKDLGTDINIAGTDYDAAHVNMGNMWMMPTRADMQELMNSCTWSWTSQDNVTGYLVTGPNGNSIFLPNAGYMDGTSLSNSYSSATYWSSTQGSVNNEYANTLSWNLSYNSGTRYLGYYTYAPFWNYQAASIRYMGRTIRAVAKPNANTGETVMNVVTDSTDWKLNQSSTKLYGTLSPITPVEGNITVGFLVGDTKTLVKGGELFDYQQTVSNAGSFSQTVPVHDNMGYWYRAYVIIDGDYYYGNARHYGFEMVDLGLPSGTLWANMNVGASSPEDYGNYYAWGETTPKSSYTTGTYSFRTNENLGNHFNISGTEYDAAYVNMGQYWCMPNATEMQELMNSCTWTLTSLNNVSGYLVTGPNGNTIFMPAAGYMDGTTLMYDNNNSASGSRGGSYPTSQLNGDGGEYVCTFNWCSGYSSAARYWRTGNNYEPFWGNGRSTLRYLGRTIRAVAKPNIVITDDRMMHISTENNAWAMGEATTVITGTVASSKPINGTLNVGFVVGDSRTVDKSSARAIYPNTVSTTGTFTQTVSLASGNMGYWYRAYVEYDGETYYGEPQHYGLEMVDLGLPSGTLWANMNVGASKPEAFGNYYAWGETTTKADYSSSSYTYGTENLGLNNDISGTTYDAAYVNMGSMWEMPTNVQIEELVNKCTWTWTTRHGVGGYLVTGTNGNSIFLPNAGYMNGTSLSYDDTNSNNSYHGASYWTSVLGSNSSYVYTLSWCSGYSSAARYIRSGNNSEPFWGYGRSTLRYLGRTIRAVRRSY